MKATTFLTSEEQATIEAEIARQEERTSAEFVCALASESGRYDRAESVLGVLGALIALTAVYEGPTLWAQLASAGGSWEQGERFGLFSMATAVVLGTVLGQVLATLMPGLRRPFVGAREQEEEVTRAAASVFAQRRICATQARGGVLLYLSLFEHRVVILCDQAAREALRDEDLLRLRDMAVAAVKEGRRADAFLGPLRTAGDLLAERLPNQDSACDGLPNQMLLFHPRP